MPTNQIPRLSSFDMAAGARTWQVLAHSIALDAEICCSYTGADIGKGKSIRRVIVRRSPVDGKSVFAMCALAAGERMLEYKGEITSWWNAVRRHRREGVEGHTFLFGLSDGSVIDGSRGGNSARWLTHACAPNCETIEDEGRIFVHTLRSIGAGEELFIEYLLATEDSLDEDVRAQYSCRCNTADCRHSMLADTA